MCLLKWRDSNRARLSVPPPGEEPAMIVMVCPLKKLSPDCAPAYRSEKIRPIASASVATTALRKFFDSTFNLLAGRRLSVPVAALLVTPPLCDSRDSLVFFLQLLPFHQFLVGLCDQVLGAYILDGRHIIVKLPKLLLLRQHVLESRCAPVRSETASPPNPPVQRWKS